MPQDSKCPVGSVYRALIREAQGFDNVTLWSFAVLGLILIALGAWVILRPAKSTVQKAEINETSG